MGDFAGRVGRCAMVSPWGATTWRNWQRRTFKDAAYAAGLEGVTPYSLRHSFVSLLLASGRRPGEVAEQAGHSLAVCHDTYAHVIAEFRGLSGEGRYGLNWLQ
jgi:integrase